MFALTPQMATKRVKKENRTERAGAPQNSSLAIISQGAKW